MIKSTRMRWAGNIACMGKRYAYRGLVWKPEGRRPHGRPNCRWKHIINVDRNGIGFEAVDRNYVTRWMNAIVDIGVV